MTIFSYKIINDTGDISSGKVEAQTKDEAVKLIKDDGVYLVEFKEGAKGLSLVKSKQRKFSSFEKINFTDHLASLIKAGTPIKDALEAYIDEKSEGSDLIREIIKDIERGKKLSDAFSKHPDVFSPLYISLIKAGEVAGNLDETLEYLANELRREHEFVQRVKSALFYPSLVLGVSFFVITFIVVFLVPKITEISKNLGQDIPTTTKIIITLSDFFSNNLIYFGMALFFLILALIYSLRNKKVREKIGVKMLKVPGIGKILKKYILARLMRIVGSCVKYGIPLTVAFDTAGEVVGNLTYRQSCEALNQKIQKGISLSDAIGAENKELFPSIITRSVRGAEKTGGVDTTLNRLSVQYEIEVDRDLKKLTELLEPILVVILGLIVLLIAISVVTPIYQLTTGIQ